MVRLGLTGDGEANIDMLTDEERAAQRVESMKNKNVIDLRQRAPRSIGSSTASAARPTGVAQVNGNESGKASESE